MTTVVSIDEFVTDTGYPGSPGFHWPRGPTPMGLISMTDGYAGATQHAAEAVSLPTLPIWWGCLAAAEAIGTDEPDDTLFLFWPEIMSILDGRETFATSRPSSLIAAR